MKVEVRIKGKGAVTERCRICKREIGGDAIRINREGSIVVYHSDCLYVKEND